MTEADDQNFMQRALDIARKAAMKEGAGPIGCVIVLDGQIVAEGNNEVEIRHDPTAHAEMVTMRRAGEALQSTDFRGATLYSTLQPCGMCTMASIWSKVTRIVYGAGREQVHRMYFEDRHLDTMDFIRDAFRKDLSITGGVLADACAELYYKPDEVLPKELQANI